MTDDYIRVGDIVEIDYITEFAKEHINEGKALVIWKGFNHQPLVRNLDTKATTWTCYEHIAKVVGHIDIVGYMDRALSAEPCDDAISRQAVLDGLASIAKVKARSDAQKSLMGRIMFFVEQLPPFTPEEKTGKWIDDEFGSKCSRCGTYTHLDKFDRPMKFKYCSMCGAKMQEVENEDSD